MNLIKHFSKKELGGSKNDKLISNIDFDSDSKQILSFCLLQTALREGKEYEIIKYDSAHGFCHAHKYFEDLTDERVMVEPQINAKTIHFLRKDIKENWLQYKSIYFWKRFKQMV